MNFKVKTLPKNSVVIFKCGTLFPIYYSAIITDIIHNNQTYVCKSVIKHGYEVENIKEFDPATWQLALSGDIYYFKRNQFFGFFREYNNHYDS